MQHIINIKMSITVPVFQIQVIQVKSEDAKKIGIGVNIKLSELDDLGTWIEGSHHRDSLRVIKFRDFDRYKIRLRTLVKDFIWILEFPLFHFLINANIANQCNANVGCD